MSIKKGFITAILIGSMVMLSGCSVKETLQLFLGNTEETEEEGTQEVFDPDAMQVDTSIEAPTFSTNLEGKATYAIGDEAKALKVKAEVQGEVRSHISGMSIR